MVDQARSLAAWRNVATRYTKGYCVSERGLQAYLVSALDLLFPEYDVIVEPYWQAANKKPDIVMTLKGQITDIFELKYAPHTRVKYEPDLDKLAAYISDPRATYPVKIDASSGHWEAESRTLHPDVALHFVVVASSDAAAVWPQDVFKHPAVRLMGKRFRHWFGRTGSDLMEGWQIA